MSTTFGVRIPSTNEIKPIARRVGVGNGKVEVWFTEPLAELLDDELEVIGIDNTNQGINTIKDIKNHITNQESHSECECIMVCVCNMCDEDEGDFDPFNQPNICMDCGGPCNGDC